jgi:hypothetical protein
MRLMRAIVITAEGEGEYIQLDARSKLKYMADFANRSIDTLLWHRYVQLKRQTLNPRPLQADLPSGSVLLRRVMIPVAVCRIVNAVY